MKVRANIDKQTFLPLLSREKASWKSGAYYHYYEYPDPHRVPPHFGIRTEQYTLVRFYGPDDIWELYDIKKDPQNLKNIYGAKGSEKITAELKKQLRQLIEKYKDDEALAIMNKDSGSKK